MTSFLLDANLSPDTSTFLRATLGFDVIDLRSLGFAAYADPAIVRFAQGERRTIVTLDLDFGDLFHRANLGMFGVIILRLDDQTVESVNRVLERFFRGEADGLHLDRSLIVLDERRSRVVAAS